MPKITCLLLAFFVATPILAASNDVTLPARRTGAPQETYLLRSARRVGSIDRVVAVLDVGGEVKYAEKDKIEKPKMSVVANLAYDERTLAMPTNGGRRRAVRFYDRADAVIKIADGGVKPALREDRRLIGVEIAEPKMTFFSPQGTLTREELDLVEMLGDSLLIEGFLPERPVAKGESWSHSKSLLAAAFGLDEIRATDVKSTLTEVTDASAVIELVGRIDGAVGGVTSRIAVKAKYRFSRKSKRIDWFGLAVREDRDVGHVAQGLDVVAKLKMQIQPRDKCERLSDDALRGLALTPTDAATQLLCESPKGDWQFSHDRRWFTVSNEHDMAVLRLIDRGELVAQCNVAPLARALPGKQATLEAFQEDIKEVLGKNFGQFISAAQRANDKNYRVLHVVAGGTVSELPIQWHYYLVADEQGNQVVFTFTVEESLAKRLGEIDRDLVGSFAFADREVAMKDKRMP
jgi:hypothetical protein